MYIYSVMVACHCEEYLSKMVQLYKKSLLRCVDVNKKECTTYIYIYILAIDKLKKKKQLAYFFCFVHGFFLIVSYLFILIH